MVDDNKSPGGTTGRAAFAPSRDGWQAKDVTLDETPVERVLFEGPEVPDWMDATLEHLDKNLRSEREAAAALLKDHVHAHVEELAGRELEPALAAIRFLRAQEYLLDFSLKVPAEEGTDDYGEWTVHVDRGVLHEVRRRS